MAMVATLASPHLREDSCGGHGHPRRDGRRSRVGAAAEAEEREEREAASESEADSHSGEAVRDLSHVQALLDSIHIDINNEGFDDEDMEEQMGEEDAAARAADEMVEGFWA